jgi:hypothetical protein
MNITVNPRALTCPVAMISIIHDLKLAEWDTIGDGDHHAMNEGLWAFRRAATWLPPECDEGADFQIGLIETYVDLLELTGFLNRRERVEAWEAIGRMVAFLARYKTDTEWWNRWERFRREVDLVRRLGHFDRLREILKPFKRPMVLGEPLPLAA